MPASRVWAQTEIRECSARAKVGEGHFGESDSYHEKQIKNRISETRKNGMKEATAEYCRKLLERKSGT